MSSVLYVFFVLFLFLTLYCFLFPFLICTFGCFFRFTFLRRLGRDVSCKTKPVSAQSLLNYGCRLDADKVLKLSNRMGRTV